MLQHHLQSGSASTGRIEIVPCIVRAMITSQGYGLIVELFAAALLLAALTGFFVQRSKPWLVGVTVAFMLLIVAATVLIASST
jgi:hypothetical protein